MVGLAQASTANLFDSAIRDGEFERGSIDVQFDMFAERPIPWGNRGDFPPAPPPPPPAPFEEDKTELLVIIAGFSVLLLVVVCCASLVFGFLCCN